MPDNIATNLRRALAALRKEAKKAPTYGNLVNLAVALRACGEIEAAAGELRRALAMEHNRAEAWNNLGQCATDLGQFDKAPGLFQRALQCHEKSGVPIDASTESLLAFAYAMMRLGQFEYIWPVWEAARFGRSWHPFPNLPVWRGEPGARLLVCPEGGFGDGFNFLRWAPRLVDALQIPPTILIWDQLFEYVKYTLRGKNGIVANVLPMKHAFTSQELARYTHCTSMLSLPGLCGMKSWADIPAPLDWTPQAHIVHPPLDWIGYCWAAEENGVARKTRSLDNQAASRIGQALARKCEKVVSLVPAGKSLYRPRAEFVPKGVTQDEALLSDWEETARTILKCGLVVTVDTAVFWLAQSLGVRTLLLLPLRSDWKWGLPNQPFVWGGNHVVMFRNTNPVTWDVAGILEVLKSM